MAQRPSLAATFALVLSLALAVVCAPSRAHAIVNQVDGTIVPQTSAMQSCLDKSPTLTPANPAPGEGPGVLDAVRAASTIPQTFLPAPRASDGRRIVRFTDIGEGAGYQNRFGWYNVGDTPFTAAPRREVFDCRGSAACSCPCNAGPRTVMRADAMCTRWVNPNIVELDFDCLRTAGVWRGGPVAFYLLTPELIAGGSSAGSCAAVDSTVNRVYSTDNSINDDGDYVHFLIYTSRTFTNSYWFGWEDLFRGGDNDFEDMLIRADGLVPTCVPSPEVCDGRDNNCNGMIDEGLGTTTCGVGLCLRTVNNCEAGRPQTCTPGAPATEICDGLDNNCNGAVDEGVTRACTTACGPGLQYCTAGTFGGCVSSRAPTAEVCNNVDDNCNGMVDEGLRRPCSTVCGMGSEVCAAGAWGMCDAPVPSAEVCDGLDNNCNGLVDEAVPTRPCMSACGPGTERCVGGRYVCDAPTPSPEVCNGRDDDCNGMVDDGVPPGGSCGRGVGACMAGMFVCEGGTYVCRGATMGTPEVCNGIDDDCNGLVDDGIPAGAACNAAPDGTPLCMPGMQRCVMGRMQCVGGTRGSPEICDCMDNDCNGMVDDGAAGSLCAGGAACIACQCRRPCDPNVEFPCSPGLVCRSFPDGHFCVPPQCGGRLCADGEVCVNDRCTDPCTTVMCADGQVCRMGRCVENSCYVIGCANPTERCIDNRCQPDRCAGMTCAAGQFCRDGACVGSCGPVTCPAGQGCRDGACVADPCEGFMCPAGQACTVRAGAPACTADPCASTRCGPGRRCEAGTCVDDPCVRVTCPDPANEVCRGAGQCEPRVPRPRVVRDRGIASGGGGFGGCAVGAVGNGTSGRGWIALVLVAAGIAAAGRRRRAEASRGARRARGLVGVGAGGGEGRVSAWDAGAWGVDWGRRSHAVIPASAPPGTWGVDWRRRPHPPAPAPEDRGRGSTANSYAMERACVRVDPQVNPPTNGDQSQFSRCTIGSTPPPPVFGGGGRGVGATSPVHAPRPRSLARAGHGVGATSPVHAPRPRSHARADRRAAGCLLLLATLLLAAGCRNEPYCFNCQVGLDGAVPDRVTVVPDARPADACTATSVEVCNGVDDDCDGEVDEGFDLQTDPANCGACGARCEVARALPECRMGGCVVRECDPGYHDLDRNPLNGCEYMCTPTGDEVCDGRDNNCDGRTDEGIDTQTDVNNCGGCGMACRPANGTGRCVMGACQVAACDMGFYDRDGMAATGCEYACMPTGPEVCDGRDNDCNGAVDEGFDLATSMANCGACGRACMVANGTAACMAGMCTIVRCAMGFADDPRSPGADCSLRCGDAMGRTGPESCDGFDNDCNGLIDDGAVAGVGDACGTSMTGACRMGRNVCSAGRLRCTGDVGPSTEICDGVDNDCNGMVDDGALPGTGGTCGSNVGQCRFGTFACTGGAIVCAGGVLPGAEVCDGLDNNCDGRVDEGLTPPASLRCNARGGETTGVCATATRACAGAAGWRCFYPTTYRDRADEALCDALDNNCDGRTDEGCLAPFPAASDVQLDPGMGNTIQPAITGDGASALGVAYTSRRAGAADVFFVRSTNNGASWTAETRLDTGATNSVTPALAWLTGGTDVYAVWSDFRTSGNYRDVFGNASRGTSGASWLAADVRVNTGQADDSFNTHVVATMGQVIAVWEAQIDLSRARHIFFSVSNDRGLTWGAATQLDAAPASAVASTPDVAVGAPGRVYVVWRDSRNGLPDVYLHAIVMGVRAPGGDLRMDTDAAGTHASELPSVAADAAGNVYVAWQDVRGGTVYDVYANRSVDGGATFLAADVRVERDAFPNDSIRPHVLAMPGGAAVVVWEDYRWGLPNVYASRSSDRGATWLATDVPVMAGLPGRSAATEIAAAAAGDTVFAVWADSRNGRPDIYANYSLDGGLTFQPADVRLDASAAGSSDSEEPRVFATGTQAHVVWVDRRADGVTGRVFYRGLR